jgi:hypothetical protein
MATKVVKISDSGSQRVAKNNKKREFLRIEENGSKLYSFNTQLF